MAPWPCDRDLNIVRDRNYTFDVAMDQVPFRLLFTGIVCKMYVKRHKCSDYAGHVYRNSS